MKRLDIVVIDDHLSLLEILEYKLTKEGFEVHPYQDLEDALSDRYSHPTDLVVFSSDFPEMENLQLQKELLPPHFAKIPMIEIAERGQIIIPRGMISYVFNKPLRMSSILRTIHQLLPPQKDVS